MHDPLKTASKRVLKIPPPQKKKIQKTPRRKLEHWSTPSQRNLAELSGGLRLRDKGLTAGDESILERLKVSFFLTLMSVAPSGYGSSPVSSHFTASASYVSLLSFFCVRVFATCRPYYVCVSLGM